MDKIIILCFQFQEADMFLGDIPISWERMKAVDFTFFTLADSGAFITHAPKQLNEAFALIRPFRFNVWPALFITIAISGPMLYLIIIIPMMWENPKQFNKNRKNRRNNKNKRKFRKIKKVETNLNFFYHISYIKEMRHEQLIEQCNRNNNNNKKINFPYDGDDDKNINNEEQPKKESVEDTKKKTKRESDDDYKRKLLSKCVWFTINIYLCQCKCLLLHHYLVENH